jgi:hypothetical protein
MCNYIIIGHVDNMTQTRRDSKLMRVLGERLRELVDEHLGVTWEFIAAQLGYANASTLRKARDGAALLSIEKLMRLALLEVPDGRRVCIDWLLTGAGEPLRSPQPEADALERSAHRCPPALLQRLARATPDLQHKIEVFLEVQGA